jgi:hypothetical protein
MLIAAMVIVAVAIFAIIARSAVGGTEEKGTPDNGGDNHVGEENTSLQPEDWQRRLEMLRSVPYLGYAQTAADDSLRGVTFHDPDRTWRGYNFYSTWATGEAFFVDMDGAVVHRWTFWPERRINPDYAFMLADGGLLLIHEYAQLKRLNWSSEILWQRDIPAHHEAVWAPDGTIWTITRSLRSYRDHQVWFDDLVHLSSRGEDLGRWSTYEQLDRLRRTLDTSSFLDTYLDHLPAMDTTERKETSQVTTSARSRHGDLDYFHLNAISPLPDTPLGNEDDRFRAGNLLICLRNVNQIAVLDWQSGDILWSWGEGRLEWPHHPTLLDNGHILLFDNGVRRGSSRVVEMDPRSGEIVWQYRANPPEAFYSYGRGSAQRLPNGNTLICESDKGCVFEITPQGERVWVWWNPLMKRDRHGTVYRMIRWPVEVVEPLLRGKN